MEALFPENKQLYIWKMRDVEAVKPQRLIEVTRGGSPATTPMIGRVKTLPRPQLPHPPEPEPPAVALAVAGPSEPALALAPGVALSECDVHADHDDADRA
eukprot:5140744-Alexandrium_andersonii.AAC.1